MRVLAADLDDLELIGGHLAVDLVNTVDCRGAARPVERLPDWATLLAWCRRVGVHGARRQARLAALMERRPGVAEAAHARLLGERERLHRMFTATRDGAAPRRADVVAFNHLLATLAPRRHLVFTGGRFAWRQAAGDADADALMAALFWPAADLLASPRLVALRRCAGADCGWLFLDSSRNRSRRWCSMRSCGNRAKARRHYRRHRG